MRPRGKQRGSNLHYATVLPSMKKHSKFLKNNQVAFSNGQGIMLSRIAPFGSLWGLGLSNVIHGEYPMEKYSGNFLRILHHWNYSGLANKALSFMILLAPPWRAWQLFVHRVGLAWFFSTSYIPWLSHASIPKFVYIRIYLYMGERTLAYPFKYSGRHSQRLRFFFAL